MAVENKTAKPPRNVTPAVPPGVAQRITKRQQRERELAKSFEHKNDMTSPGRGSR